LGFATFSGATVFGAKITVATRCTVVTAKVVIRIICGPKLAKNHIEATIAVVDRIRLLQFRRNEICVLRLLSTSLKVALNRK
jgi:hypothetical protein